jgi:hypothetical protein
MGDWQLFAIYAGFMVLVFIAAIAWHLCGDTAWERRREAGSATERKSE